MKVFMISADITQVPVDVIATLINPDGMWYGGVDGAIQRIAGSQYHAQAFDRLESVGLIDGEAVVAKKKQTHAGSFKDVIFVVDELRIRLSQLVFTILKTAEIAGYASVGLPLMRTGVMLGVVESCLQEVAEEIKGGIIRFGREYPESKLMIVLVVYGETQVMKFLEDIAKPLSV